MKNPFKLAFLSLSLVLLAACNSSQTGSSETDAPVNDDMEMQDEAPSAKLMEGTKELPFAGNARFVTKVDKISCKDYAMDSEYCTDNPEGTLKLDSYFLEISSTEVNSELMSALDAQTQSMVKKEGENYLVNLGCKGDNQIEGDTYGVYKNDKINEAFENGDIYMVDFMINIAPEGGDPACASLITKFNSMTESA